jgi:hypothetical protein
LIYFTLNEFSLCVILLLIKRQRIWKKAAWL